MKYAQGQVEDGIVIGNTYDKYGTTNPIAKKLMAGFGGCLNELIDIANPSSVHEVGCGEGYWVGQLWQRAIDVKGTDFSEAVIAMAKENAKGFGVPPSAFSRASVYDLKPETHGADLIMCCEVMEHLEEPEKALNVLHSLAGRYVILSVPHEPIWRILNMARGKYVSDLGNTPGHVQHWTQKGFKRFVSRRFNIVESRSPLPWTMVLATPK